MRTRRTRRVVVVLVVFGLGPTVHALINPRFTPIDLVEQSRLVVKVTFGPVKDKRCVCTVGKVLKGKTAQKMLTLDFGQAMNDNEAGRMARQIAAAGNEPGALFVGDEALADEKGRARAFLHVAGKWIDLRGGEGDAWCPKRLDTFMEGCWAGGTDMLLRAVAYILADEDADVPCTAGASWGKVVKAGRVGGAVTSAGAVDLDGTGKLGLFVTSTAGDRLFEYGGDALKDVTAERKLRSKSRASAWIDWNGDGKLDLVSWDGTSLGVYLRQGGAAFGARSPLAGAAVKGCLGLSAVDVGGGRAGLLVTTADGATLLAPDGAAKPRKLAGPPPGKPLGRPAACLVADFDGDGHADVIQPFEKGGLLHRGRGAGRFAAPTRCGVALGTGTARLGTGDFDADGLLDVVSSGKAGCEIWQNAGGGRFVPRKRLSGEIAYISKTDAVGCQACDVNNDGRQDVFIAYEAMGAQIFFNRGFRSTGHAHKLDLTDNGLLPPAEKGQQAGCIADFNADGAQDMVLVLKGGDVHVFWRDIEEASGLSATVGLSPKGPCPGPLTVTGWLDGRRLGAWNVVAGGSTAFVGLLDVAEVKITWRPPGGKLREKKVVVEDNPVSFLIGR